MNEPTENRRLEEKKEPDESTELLILRDGKVLVHNLTPTFARLLGQLNPDDPRFGLRSRAGRGPLRVRIGARRPEAP